MPRLSETIAQLSRMRGMAMPGGDPGERATLDDLADFGSNPGNLRARTFVPDDLPGRPALVVVLHGCTQTAGGYDTGSGWSQLAERHGFALLLPEQGRANNPNLCFNWFSPDDNRRGAGEALSIRQMVAAMVDRHDVDPARIFVTGLSAGGAMASVMLACYPEVFAGGAIIAGLPHGVASSIPQALEVMRGQRLPGADGLAALVRDASPHRGPWPTVSVWHGSGDATVSPANADAIVGQWRTLHGVTAEPSRELVDGHPRRVWRDATGREVIEEYAIAGMGHGTPLATGGDDGCGRSGEHMLEAGISSTRHICRFWGLTADGATRPATVVRPDRQPTPAVLTAQPTPAVLTAQPTSAVLTVTPAAPAPPPTTPGVGRVIEDALRAAGLMR